MTNIYAEQGTAITWPVPVPCPHNEQVFDATTVWCETCGEVLRSSVMRVALRNEFGGVTRTVEVSAGDEGVVWQYAYDEAHREQYPATRNTVQVQMRDGSWCNGTVLS